MRVLVVDDLSVLRQHAAAMVKQVVGDKAEVIEAHNGTEALDLYKRNTPDLIVMDINMPDMSGIKCAEQIWKTNPAQKILFWSQFAKESYVRTVAKILPDEAIHGYALKSELDDNLKYAIESVLLRDNPYIDPKVRGVQTRLQSKDGNLSDVEYETLLDVAVGLTDRAISMRRHISVRGAQKRISSVLEKLLKGDYEYAKESAGVEILNPRTRLLCEAFKRGLLDTEEIVETEKAMFEWLEREIYKAT
jgi:DNA-binding NarL/FixJ family response regulator